VRLTSCRDCLATLDQSDVCGWRCVGTALSGKRMGRCHSGAGGCCINTFATYEWIDQPHLDLAICRQNWVLWRSLRSRVQYLLTMGCG